MIGHAVGSLPQGEIPSASFAELGGSHGAGFRTPPMDCLRCEPCLRWNRSELVAFTSILAYRQSCKALDFHSKLLMASRGFCSSCEAQESRPPIRNINRLLLLVDTDAIFDRVSPVQPN